MRIALVANTGWYLYNFRLNLMRSLLVEGHAVVAISPQDDYSRRLSAEGIAIQHWELSGASRNPFRELAAVVRLRRALKVNDVDVVLSFTPKGNVYAGIACIGSLRRTVPNVSGLGRVFSKRGWMQLLMITLYRVALFKAFQVFFQNEDDREVFLRAGLLPREKTERLMGSGVDLSRFRPEALPCTTPGGEREVVFLLVARLLWEKGVAQYVEAARALKVECSIRVRCLLLGALSPESENAVKLADLEQWQREGVIEYLGTTDNVASLIRKADCVVLPSYYREGVPRTLIEGAATARPIITTDMPGCRDVVIPSRNGWLCRPRDSAALKDVMSFFVAMPSEAKQEMGNASRKLAEDVFDETLVIESYLSAIARLRIIRH